MSPHHCLSSDERGFAFAGVLLALLLLLVMGGAATMHTVLDVRSTSHYDTATRPSQRPKPASCTR